MLKKNRHKKAIKLTAVLELNQKFGYGYQVHICHGEKTESAYDCESLTLDQAIAAACYGLKEFGTISGCYYDLGNAIRVSEEALIANKNRDITSAKYFREMEQSKREFEKANKPDFKMIEIDGKEEECVSIRGFIMIAYSTWLDFGLSKARNIITRYCNYLALHGYGADSSSILAELDSKNKENGINWIKATYEKYVINDMDVITYIGIDG